jgi:hypothetical protein
MTLATSAAKVAAEPAGNNASDALPRLRWRKVALRAVQSIVALAALATMTIGLLHAPFARKLLMKVGGCPVGNEDPHAVEAARAQAVAQNAGRLVAPSRVALGFTLGSATLADAKQWESTYKLRCETQREDSWVQCTHVPAAALGTEAGFDEVNLLFHPDNRKLVSVTAYRFVQLPEPAIAHTVALRTVLEGQYGTPHASFGNVERIRAEDGATCTLNYRFRDVAVDLTSSRIAGRGTTTALSYQYIE